jgi:hypothetical protein
VMGRSTVATGRLPRRHGGTAVASPMREKPCDREPMRAASSLAREPCGATWWPHTCTAPAPVCADCSTLRFDPEFTVHVRCVFQGKVEFDARSRAKFDYERVFHSAFEAFGNLIPA